MLSFVKKKIKTLLLIKSSRGSSLAIIVLNMMSKCLGYGRTVIMAYFFGASASIDAFYVASGAVNLFVGTGRQALESAVMPQLSLAKQEKGSVDREIMAVVWWVTVLLSLIFTACALIAPGLLVRIFALGFDPHRVRTGAQIVTWLIPWGVSVLLFGVLSTWAVHEGKYTLPTLIFSSFNVFAVPALLFMIPLVGFIAVPASLSITYTILLGCLAWALRDFPYRMGKIPWMHVRKIARDVFFSLGITGAGALYGVTDTFFASTLATGAVSAISYAGVIFALPVSMVDRPLYIYLSKSCRAVAAGDSHGEDGVIKALFIAWSYFLPAGFAIAAVSVPVVSLFLGYGAFDAHAVGVTSSCLTVSAIAMPLAVSSTVMVRHAQSRQKLHLIVLFSYLTVAANILLDWLLAPRLGASGIALATSIVWFISNVLYLYFLLRNVLFKLRLSLFLLQGAIVLIWAVPLYIYSETMGFYSLPLSLIMFSVHLAVCEKLGLMSVLPEGWRPSELLTFAARGLKKIS